MIKRLKAISKKLFDRNARRDARGFTLLETLLAIGILSVVIVQVLSVQSSNVSITQVSRDNVRATWAMRQAISQLQYVLDTLGVEGLPKNPVEFAWSADEKFVVRVEVKEENIEASRLLMSAMKLASFGQQPDEESDEENDPQAALKEVASLLDSRLPKDLYRTFQIVVSWKQGDERSRQLDGGGLIIDDKLIEGMIPAATAATAPATGAGGNPAVTPSPTGTPNQ